MVHLTAIGDAISAIGPKLRLPDHLGHDAIWGAIAGPPRASWPSCHLGCDPPTPQLPMPFGVRSLHPPTAWPPFFGCARFAFNVDVCVSKNPFSFSNAWFCSNWVCPHQTSGAKLAMLLSFLGFMRIPYSVPLCSCPAGIAFLYRLFLFKFFLFTLSIVLSKPGFFSDQISGAILAMFIFFLGSMRMWGFLLVPNQPSPL